MTPIDARRCTPAWPGPDFGPDFQVPFIWLFEPLDRLNQEISVVLISVAGFLRAPGRVGLAVAAFPKSFVIFKVVTPCTVGLVVTIIPESFGVIGRHVQLGPCPLNHVVAIPIANLLPRSGTAPQLIIELPLQRCIGSKVVSVTRRCRLEGDASWCRYAERSAVRASFQR